MIPVLWILRGLLAGDTNVLIVNMPLIYVTGWYIYNIYIYNIYNISIIYICTLYFRYLYPMTYDWSYDPCFTTHQRRLFASSRQATKSLTFASARGSQRVFPGRVIVQPDAAWPKNCRANMHPGFVLLYVQFIVFQFTCKLEWREIDRKVDW